MSCLLFQKGVVLARSVPPFLQTRLPGLNVLVFCCAILVQLAVVSVWGWAQEASGTVTTKDSASTNRALSPQETEKAFEKESINLRTSLHHNPTLKVPFDRLWTLYQKQNRSEQLLSMYATHLNQYPQDASATIVYVRLLIAANRPERWQQLQQAVQRFPKESILHYLNAHELKKQFQPKWIEEFELAIELQPKLAQKRLWTEELLDLAIRNEDRKLAKSQLKRLSDFSQQPEESLKTARTMLKHRFAREALELLSRVLEMNVSAEFMIELELEASSAEIMLKQHAKAARRLDRVIGKVSPDYWRRSELMRKRLLLVSSSEERQSMLQGVKEKMAQQPDNETTLLDYVEMLTLFDLPRQALDQLLDAESRFPFSVKVEEQTLKLLERLNESEGKVDYLKRRLKRDTKRSAIPLSLAQTLFELHRDQEATTVWKGYTSSLSVAERQSLTLELARSLRKQGMTEPAKRYLEKLLSEHPERLDLLRELGELYAASGEQGQLREPIRQALELEPKIEEVLDLTRFLAQQGFNLEARELLRKSLVKEKTNLDLKLLLIQIEQQLGISDSASQLLNESRTIADTEARYRNWLHSALEFHREMETVELFLQEEIERLESTPDSLSKSEIDKLIAFVNSTRGELSAEVHRNLIQTRLKKKPETEFANLLQRQLVEMLTSRGSDPQQAEQALKNLMETDPAHREEHRARLAMVYIQTSRWDLASPLLSQIEPAQIYDYELLRNLQRSYLQNSFRDPLLHRITRRLTELKPADSENWSLWLELLALRGDETALRSNMRQLITGLGDFSLSQQTLELMKEHLIDSYWRSIARRLSQEDQGSLVECLSLLDEAELLISDPEHQLWSLWIRTKVLASLNRTEARDAARKEFQRLLQQASKRHQQENASATPSRISSVGSFRLRFPDGLTIAPQYALRVLENSPPTKRQEISKNGKAGSPLVQNFQVAWKYESDRNLPITGVTTLGAKKVLVRDQLHNYRCLDASSGKLLWTKTALDWNLRIGNRYGVRSTAIEPYPLTIGKEGDADVLFVIPEYHRLSCFSAGDGSLRWRVSLPASDEEGRALEEYLKVSHNEFQTKGTPFPWISVACLEWNGSLLAYELESGELIQIDPHTGKVQNDFLAASEKRLFRIDEHIWERAGVSLSGDQLLVYGPRSFVFNLKTGQQDWEFQPSHVRSFPLTLKEKDEENLLLSELDKELQSEDPSGDSASFASPESGSFSFSGPFLPDTQDTILLPHQPSIMKHFPLAKIKVAKILGKGNGNLFSWNYLNQNHQEGNHFSAMFPLPSLLKGTAPPMNEVTFRLVPPAVAWAANLQQPGQSGRGVILDDQLMLQTGSMLRSLSLSFPLASFSWKVKGRFLGKPGHLFCYLDQQNLTLVDVRQNRYEVISLDQPGLISFPGSKTTSGFSGKEVLEVFLDGHLLVVLSRTGITGLHLKKRNVLYRTNWKETLNSKDAKSIWKRNEFTRGVVAKSATHYFVPLSNHELVAIQGDPIHE